MHALWRFRFLTTDHIQTVTCSRSRDKLNKRLKQLYDAKYLDRPAVQAAMFSHADKRPLVHALGNAGAAWIRDQGLGRVPDTVRWTDKNAKVKRPEFLLHTLGVADFYVSLARTVAATPLVSFADQDAVIATSPSPTPRLEFPLSLPTEYRWFDGSRVQRSTVPDGVFRLTDGRGEKERNAFHFLEYDGNTMPVVRRTANQSSIVQKLFGYADVRDRRLHTKRFGSRNFRVLFVTSGRERIQTMTAAYREHVQMRCPAGAFLFADRADLLERGPLGDVWVDGDDRRVELIPGLSPAPPNAQ